MTTESQNPGNEDLTALILPDPVRKAEAAIISDSNDAEVPDWQLLQGETLTVSDLDNDLVRSFRDAFTTSDRGELRKGEVLVTVLYKGFQRSNQWNLLMAIAVYQLSPLVKSLEILAQKIEDCFGIEVSGGQLSKQKRVGEVLVKYPEFQCLNFSVIYHLSRLPKEIAAIAETGMLDGQNLSELTVRKVIEIVKKKRAAVEAAVDQHLANCIPEEVDIDTTIAAELSALAAECERLSWLSEGKAKPLHEPLQKMAARIKEVLNEGQ